MNWRDFGRRVIWAGGAVAAAKLLLSITVPFPDALEISKFVHVGGPLLKLYSFFTGGAVAQGTPFALGIMPYLSARMFMFIARTAGAPLDDPTRAKWWTRGLTVGLAGVQSLGYALATQKLPGATPGVAYVAEVVVMLTTVSTLIMLFAEEATAPEPEAVRETPRFPLPSADIRRSERSRQPDARPVSHSTPLP